MSVWRNEQDFMKSMDMLSEFYIKDKKVTTPKKLNVQTQKQYNRTWYESESDDDSNEKPQNAGESSKCPSMEPIDTLEMMQSIRMQVRNVVGGRYNNEVLETYFRMNQEPENEPSTSNELFGGLVPFVPPQVNELSSITAGVTALSTNGHKTDAKKPIASSSKCKIDNSNNVKNKSHTRGKSYSNRGGGRGPSRYHNNVAFTSLQSKESYNYKSNNDFPPL